MLRKIVTVTGLLLLILALTPPTLSLYELTGEENTAGQLRGLLQWAHSAIRPQPQLARGAGMDHVDVSPFGVNTFLQSEALPEVREQSVRLIGEAGFRFIRQEFTWEDIEIHGKGDFVDLRNDLDGDGQPDPVDAWAKYDNIVSLAQAYDVEIIARLGNPPAWTRALTDTIGTNAPPDDFSDFGDFVEIVAARYAGQITYYQVWNEPNGNEEWGLQDVDPEAYTELLCLAYERIKAADEGAVVLAGALTPTVAMEGRNLNALIYLERMYAAGAGDCFDVMSAQGYGLWSGPTDQRLRPTVINYPYHLFIRDVMVQNGDAHKPIWISEMGWNAVPDGIPPIYGQVSEAQQARYAVEAFERARRDWPWVGVVNYWFFKRPGDSERDQAWYYFRMMEPDFTALPVWEAVANYAPSPPAVESPTDTLYLWQQWRPLLFLLGSALLFFTLLWSLAPPLPSTNDPQ
ncbi:MAG TPA: cellulase family glycosylhydrolase [Candidatus Sulfomarinibacteraceae bacterium]|nr:cellulase family glycosylhydrolase [Candidatus Sulfomarinibacteraceae bacterium]